MVEDFVFYFFWLGILHFLEIMQSGQKLNKPANRGKNPKKNHGATSIAPNCIRPVTISAKPIAIRNTLQNDLILLKSII
jgi:hypothetical protein